MKTYHELVLAKARAELDEARAIARGDIDMARAARVRFCEAQVALAELALSQVEPVAAVPVPESPAKDGGTPPAEQETPAPTTPTA